MIIIQIFMIWSDRTELELRASLVLKPFNLMNYSSRLPVRFGRTESCKCEKNIKKNKKSKFFRSIFSNRIGIKWTEPTSKNHFFDFWDQIIQINRWNENNFYLSIIRPLKSLKSRKINVKFPFWTLSLIVIRNIWF